MQCFILQCNVSVPRNASRKTAKALYALCIKQTYNCTTYVMTNKPNKTTGAARAASRMKEHDDVYIEVFLFNSIQRNIADREIDVLNRHHRLTIDRSIDRQGGKTTTLLFVI